MLMNLFAGGAVELLQEATKFVKEFGGSGDGWSGGAKEFGKGGDKGDEGDGIEKLGRKLRLGDGMHETPNQKIARDKRDRTIRGGLSVISTKRVSRSLREFRGLIVSGAETHIRGRRKLSGISM
jgi:hypothetical protein